MPNKTLKVDRLLALAFFVALLTSFGGNFFRIVPQDKFSFFQADSQSLVRMKLLETANGQGVVEGGFLRMNGPFFKASAANGDAAFDPQETGRYNSQLGLQGLFAAVLSKTFSLSADQTVLLAQWLVAASGAAVFGAFFYFLLTKYGTLAALPGALIIFFSVHILYFAHNLYWVSFSLFLPYVVTLWLYPAAVFSRRAFNLLAGLLFAITYIKCLCGYEFITNIVLSASPVLLFVGIVRSIPWRRMLAHQSIFAFACILGFLLAMATHLTFLAASLGSVEAAITAVADRALQNTVDATSLTSNIVAAKYVTPGTGTILAIIKYLSFPAVNIGSYPPFGDNEYFVFRSTYFGPFALSVIMASACFTAARRRVIDPALRLSLNGVAASLPWAFVCSISWIVAAKVHSIHHFHLVSIVLCFPFLLHLGLCLAVVLQSLLTKLRQPSEFSP